MAMKNEVNVPLIITIGAVSVILLVVIIIGVQAWYLSEEREERADQWDASPNLPVVNLLKGQSERINGDYHWVDRQGRTVAIPVTEAMRVLVAHHGIVPTTQPQSR